MAQTARMLMGRGCPLCPYNSDVDLLGNFEGVIDLDAEIVRVHRS
jgi:hypothetical protein